MIRYTILVDGKWYEKYSSSARTFGGNLSLTENEREAKLITRERDAKYRVGGVRYHLTRDFIFPSLQKKYNLSDNPTVEVIKLEV